MIVFFDDIVKQESRAILVFMYVIYLQFVFMPVAYPTDLIIDFDSIHKYEFSFPMFV